MKNAVKLYAYKLTMLLVFFLTQTVLWAQDQGGSGSGSGSSSTTSSKTSVNVTSTSDDWYTSPWVWIIGAALFILLLVALLGGGRRESTSHRVKVTRTVHKDSGSDVA